ncbi:uncharacterized protein LOC115625922 [Scaptodrosophila lebanonensis]|uniref:Uncharacterized protein LOC115625922 n=1 Tax=Drosophila lebanonensis TaxID=7225 RepID=A0A6J2TPY6_DROLE|nr:uncharacterized protein LOC115625922 [Scaptodrosophila lebanonensis]
MSANNRPLAKGKDAFDSAMDESGYASFQIAHSLLNSTVEAPFLTDDTENCQNAGNITNCTHNLYKNLTSTQFQTPCSCYTGSASQCCKQVSPLTATNSSAAGTSADTSHTSPLPNQNHLASKRRKMHFQASHNSPKKSKKTLFQQDSKQRRLHYNGVEHLDIVGMMANNIPALECILSHVNAATLDKMTQVSRQWAQAVYKSPRAVERLENHRLKMNLTKENPRNVKVKRRRTRAMLNNQTVPLKPFNAITNASPNSPLFEKATSNDIQMKDLDKGHGPMLVEQSQRVKCPRCGKSSKVYRKEMIKENNIEDSTAVLSRTMPITQPSTCERKAPFTRFYSLDEMHRSPEEPTTDAVETFAECTGICCKFRFCLHCFCQSHPGEKCLVTELDTPSKIVQLPENGTPPKRATKNDAKLSRKKSLKRLCF